MGMTAEMKAQEFDFGWTKIDDASLAAFEGLLGKPAVIVDGVYWRQVRFGFYRPLMQFRALAPGRVTLPFWASMGAAQYVVPSDAKANSHLNGMFFEDPGSYCLDALDGNRSRQVRLASKNFVIRKVTNLSEFQQKGHAAYVSFLERTGYEYGEARRVPAYFTAWADKLFSIPQVLVLGAYLGAELVGISLTYLVDDTLCYATFFCTTSSMKLYVSDLMLHAIRTVAAQNPEVQRIFTGMFKGDKGLDGFYRLRGAKCVRIPAHLQINPVVKTALRLGTPKKYSKMLGNIEAEEFTH